MKWIDYTALTLAIIGAIAWGLIGIFQFNLVSFFFGENSWFSRLIYDLVGLSGLYLLTLFGRIDLLIMWIKQPMKFGSWCN